MVSNDVRTFKKREPPCVIQMNGGTTEGPEKVNADNLQKYFLSFLLPFKPIWSHRHPGKHCHACVVSCVAKNSTRGGSLRDGGVDDDEEVGGDEENARHVAHYDLAVQVQQVRHGDIDDEGDKEEDKADHPEHGEDDKEVGEWVGVEALLLYLRRVALLPFAAEYKGVKIAILVEHVVNAVAGDEPIPLVL